MSRRTCSRAKTGADAPKKGFKHTRSDEIGKTNRQKGQKNRNHAAPTSTNKHEKSGKHKKYAAKGSP